MPRFPSDEWLQRFVELVNDSADYRAAAASWEGAVVILIEAEPDKGVPEDVWCFLDLWHGACREGRIVSPEEGEEAPYVIRAPYSRWKEVIRRELDPIKGMMQGKLKLTGDLPTILRYLKASNELVGLAAAVDTDFPDE